MASRLGDWAFKAWKDRYGIEPIWDKKQWTHLTRLEKALGEQFRGTWLAYLKDPDPFYQGHQPSLLTSVVGRFQVRAELVSDAPLLETSPWVDSESNRTARKQREQYEADERRNKHVDGVKQAILRSAEKADPGIAKAALAELKGSLK